jgi:hypothetical protein
MAKKTVTSVNINKAISRTSKPSVFDMIVKEIDPSEIPLVYIDRILIQYTDENIEELKGKDLLSPIMINRKVLLSMLSKPFKQMKNVEIFINSDKLEDDINAKVENYLGIYC